MSREIKDYPLVSVYKTVADTTAMEEIPILQALFKINNGTYKHLVQPLTNLYAQGKFEEYAELKKKLPSFITAGTFVGGRKAENLNQYSNYIILDIDKLPVENIEDVKNKICEVPFTFACFISPSGVGLKIIIKVSSKPTEHLLAFNQLKVIYENALGIDIDKSGKDINRLCFFSADSCIKINYDAKIYLVQYDAPVQATIAPVAQRVQQQQSAQKHGVPRKRTQCHQHCVDH